MADLSPLGEGVYLIRHPKTALNTDGHSEDKIRGWKDIPLDATGKKQAHAIADVIARVKPAKVYSSDLERAAMPAAEGAKKAGVPHTKDKAFRPWNLGDLQGGSAKDAAPIIRSHVRAADNPIPGGESFNDFKGRYVKSFKNVLAHHLATGDNLVIVSHFRNLKLTEAFLKSGFGNMDVDLPTFLKDDVPTGAIMRIFRKAGRWQYEIVEEPVIAGEKSRVGTVSSAGVERQLASPRIGVQGKKDEKVAIVPKKVGVHKLRAGVS